MKALKKKYGDIKNYHNELHAVMIFLLLKDRTLENAEKIVLCNDYNYKKVIGSLGILLSKNQHYISKFECLFDYRKRTNNQKMKSYADNFVNTASKHNKKRKNIHRRHEVFNNFNFASLKDIDHCLQVVLSRRSPVEITNLNLDIKPQQNLNTSILKIYQ